MPSSLIPAQEHFAHIPGIADPIHKIVLGTAAFTPMNRARNFPILDRFLTLGGNAIETAQFYGLGDCERTIGAWLQERDCRDKVKILTKGAHPWEGCARVTPECISGDLEESLARLRTDYIDVYLLHRDDPEVPVGELIDCLNQHHRAGKIKSFGGSNWSAERIRAANEYAFKNNLVPFTLTSPHFSLAKFDLAPKPGCICATRQDLDWYRQQQIRVLAWSAQAHGFFTGAFTDEQTPADHPVRAWFSAKNFESLKRVKELSAEKGVSPMAIALAYVLAQDFAPFAAIGPQSTEQLEDSFTALQVWLNTDELHYLEA